MALTSQQEAFARAVAEGKSQAEAYRTAYPRSNDWKDSAVWSEASRLMAAPKVSARVAELQAEIAKQVCIEKAEVVRLLASVLTRELVRDQRLVSLRIIGDDRPGLLATVSAVIGQMGANIIEVAHNRLALDVPAKGAEFDIMIETRDAQHTQEIMDALRERGYPPRAV